METDCYQLMKDIQSLRDTRRIDIRKVGVKTITYPLTVLDKERKHQQTVATVNMYVNLPHEFKGTHMSRFIEILNQYHGQFNLETFQRILEEMKQRLEAEAAHLEIAFPYFLQSVNGGKALGTDRYECRMHGSLNHQLDLVLEVDIPVALRSLLGSGKMVPAVSRPNGNSGLWGTVKTAVRMKQFLWIEDVITLVEEAISTTASDENSVESMCKKISTVLSGDDAFEWYKVVVENLASGYATFACAEG